MRSRALLLLAMTLVAACGADVPVAEESLDNDPVPLTADMDRLLMPGSGHTLTPADATSPQISARAAVEVGRKTLREEMAGNNVPSLGAPAPDALVRRVLVTWTRPGRPRARPISVWVVAFRWKFNCHGPGGPGPCDTISFYFIDDRTGHLVTSYTAS